MLMLRWFFIIGIHMYNFYRYATFFTAIAGSLFFSAHSHAASLSTFRIYLDNEHRAESFLIFSKNGKTEECSLSLTHNNFDKESNIQPYKGEELPENSAEPWIRFSPKQFIVDASEPQTIRFTMRRKANTSPQEFRSYLTIKCDDKEILDAKKSANAPTVVIKPRLVQNVPIIVRTAKLEAQLTFTNITTEDNNVKFTIMRTGERSVYGSVELINKETEQVISSLKSISIYPESQYKHMTLPTNGVPYENISIRFVEDSNYGGTITAKVNVM